MARVGMPEMSQQTNSSVREWRIEKFALCVDERWRDIIAVNMALSLQGDALRILIGRTAIHSLRLDPQVKAYLKGNVVILAYVHSGKTLKLKMKISNGLTDVGSILNALAANAVETQEVISQTRDISKDTQQFDSQSNANKSDGSLDAFILQCLIDPTFQNMVEQIEKSLQKHMQ